MFGVDIIVRRRKLHVIVNCVHRSPVNLVSPVTRGNPVDINCWIYFDSKKIWKDICPAWSWVYAHRNANVLPNHYFSDGKTTFCDEKQSSINRCLPCGVPSCTTFSYPVDRCFCKISATSSFWFKEKTHNFRLNFSLEVIRSCHI